MDRYLIRGKGRFLENARKGKKDCMLLEKKKQRSTFEGTRNRKTKRRTGRLSMKDQEKLSKKKRKRILP